MCRQSGLNEAERTASAWPGIDDVHLKWLKNLFWMWNLPSPLYHYLLIQNDASNIKTKNKFILALQQVVLWTLLEADREWSLLSLHWSLNPLPRSAPLLLPCHLQRSCKGFPPPEISMYQNQSKVIRQFRGTNIQAPTLLNNISLCITFDGKESVHISASWFWHTRGAEYSMTWVIIPAGGGHWGSAATYPGPGQWAAQWAVQRCPQTQLGTEPTHSLCSHSPCWETNSTHFIT